MRSDLVEEGFAALRDGSTAAARRAFELALAEAETGDALEGLGESLYLDRDYSGSAERYEHAYSAYRRRGDTMAAGRAARMVAWILGNVLGGWAVQSGWLARARTTLEEAGEDRPERGWSGLPEAPMTMFRRWVNRPWSAPCWLFSWTSISKRTTLWAPNRWPSAWARWRRLSGAPISKRPPLWQRDVLAPQASEVMLASACTKRSRSSHGLSFRWSWHGRVWS